jgi:hypothetical protein
MRASVCNEINRPMKSEVRLGAIISWRSGRADNLVVDRAVSDGLMARLVALTEACPRPG